jgi:hypothetical protein
MLPYKYEIYFEKFSILSLLQVARRAKVLNEDLKRNDLKIFYIDITLCAEKMIVPLLRACGLNLKKLDFKMMDVKDEEGELVRIRISRRDLFDIQGRMEGSEAYKYLCHESWQRGRVRAFINRGLISGSILNEDSIARFIFIIQVVAWHMGLSGCAESTFIVRKRPWFYIFRDYAAEYGIDLYKGIDLYNIKHPARNVFRKSFIRKILINYPRLYEILRRIQHGQIGVNNERGNNSSAKVYIQGRGDLSLVNDGHHSDFFWKLNSEFQNKNILYSNNSKQEKTYLENHGIHSVEEGSFVDDGFKFFGEGLQLHNYSRFIAESRAIQPILGSYDFQLKFWGSFFNAHGVKIFFTWLKYDHNHMAIADAISENGGISVIWEMSFGGYKSVDSRVSSDICFSFSGFSHEIDRQLKSDIKYNVITGYPRDYAGCLLKKEALRVREKLNSNGAEKIVFVIDENSVDDERWHTGHGLQRENYSYILEKVLGTPWLGVIFKPKVARTLRERLGPVAELLAHAEKTGRCYIYEDSGRFTTSAPPVLAGLSADVCIHGHLCNGTAGLECALEGLPTLLIDREGCPNSKLYELPEGKVIFKDWPGAIDAVMENFQVPGGIPGFGDWSSLIDELDPFRDGKAAYRMGTYLHWLIQGFEKGMEREEIMADAAERYRKQWGDDKVLTP